MRTFLNKVFVVFVILISIVLFPSSYTIVQAAVEAPEHLELLKDIYPGSGSSSGSRMFKMNSNVYFMADDGTNGYELWVTDGTESGTRMIKNINTAGDSLPNYFAVMNNKLYFQATDATYGAELWVTDGTESGTTMVKDIYTGLSSSSPSYMTTVGSTLYFYATDGSTGNELWKSDGTEGGTTLVKDIRTGATGSISTFTGQYPFAAYNNLVIFKANDGTNGVEMWRSDGTEVGTTLIKDVNPGAGNGVGNHTSRGGLVGFDNGVFFIGNDGSTGNEPWVTDGTSVGTVQLEDMNSGVSSGLTSNLATYLEFNGKAFFNATHSTDGAQLYVTDGTPSGTVYLHEDLTSASLSQYRYHASDNYLYLENGMDIWKTDGTPSGTTKLITVDSGTVSDINLYGPVGDYIAFNATNDGTNYELWRTTGEGNNIVQVEELYPSGSSTPSVVNFFLNSKLYILATDGGTYGQELWSYWIESVTNSNTSSSSPRPEGEFSTTEAPTCKDATPIGAPHLFQIDRVGDKATVHFTPVSGSVNHYFISYGLDATAEGYSGEYGYSKPEGAIAETINFLAPNTPYYFKVRAGNGCMPGDWSQVIKR